MSAAAKFFVDTNVVLYAVDWMEPVKHSRAGHWLSFLWAESCGCVSYQVLHEFYSNATKKGKLPAVQARAAVRSYLQWEPLGVDARQLERAWHWCDAAQLSYWDALIVAAAEHTSCRYLLSEDFQAGRKFAGVTVVNPFEQSPAEFQLGIPLLDQ